MRAFVAVSLLMFAASPAAAQHLGARVQWQPEIASPDARLAQPVDIEILGRAAVPALEMLSEATGVSLTVAPEDLDTVGERKLTIISKDLSLKAIMVQLPEALQECHWDIDDSGDEPVYLLHRNAGVEASLEQEQQDRRAEFEAQRQERRRDSVDDVRRALTMSPEELVELEKTDLFLARAAQHPLWRKLMEAYASLPQEYLSELVEAGDVKSSYSELPPAFRETVCCSFELQRHYLLWKASQPQAEDTPFSQGRAQEMQQLNQLADKIATRPDPDLEVRIWDTGGREVSYGAILSVDLDDMSVGTMMVPARYTRMRWAGNPYQWLLVETGDTPEEAQRAVEHSCQEWVRLRDERQWDESDWVEPSDPRLHVRADIPVRGDEGAQYVSVLELQQLIAAETGISIVSDYFTKPSAGIYPGQQPLGEALWRDLYILGQSGSFTWRLVGDCLVFHHTNWAWLAQRELPESLLLSYRERLERQGRFTLDDVIDLAAEVNVRAQDKPLRGGFSLPADLAAAGADAALAESNRQLLLVYRALTPDERARAEGEEGLRLGDLTQGRRASLAAAAWWPMRDPSRDNQIAEDVRGAVFLVRRTKGADERGAYVRYTLSAEVARDESQSMAAEVMLRELKPLSDGASAQDNLGE